MITPVKTYLFLGCLFLNLLATPSNPDQPLQDLQKCKKNNQILSAKIKSLENNFDVDLSACQNDVIDCMAQHNRQEHELRESHYQLTFCQQNCLLEEVRQRQNYTQKSLLLMSSLAVFLLVIKLCKPMFSKKTKNPHPGPAVSSNDNPI